MQKLAIWRTLVTIAAAALLSSSCGQADSVGDGERDEARMAGAKPYCEAASRIEHFPVLAEIPNDEIVRAASEYATLGIAASEAAPDAIRAAANTVADAMTAYAELVSRARFNSTQKPNWEVAVVNEDLMTAERLIAKWLPLNCPDDLDDPASVVEHLFEVSGIGLEDRETLLRESIALFSDEAVLSRHPDTGGVPVVGADEIGAVLQLGYDAGVESEGVEILWARGDTVVWNEIWLQPDGSTCAWSENKAVVIDGRITNYRVGDVSCTP